MKKIKSIKARRVLNSRGEPTVEAQLLTDDGIFTASVPSGASKGEYEAVVRSAEEAIKNIRTIIAPALKGKDASRQKEIDELLIGLDGTRDKSRLGANAILAVSMACCRAGAGAGRVPLYRHIGQISGQTAGSPLTMPVPCFNVINGGAHARQGLDIQEIMLVPQFSLFSENLNAGKKTYQALRALLKERFGKKGLVLGDEAGFSAPLKTTKEALDLLTRSAEQVGYRENVKFGLDCAASQFFTGRDYSLEDRRLSSAGLTDFYWDIAKKYHILFLEDPYEQNDWEGWQMIMSNVKCQMLNLLIIGDDLTVTNPERIRLAREKNACDGVIIKPNQIGTVTETFEAVKLAKKYNWKIIVSHRSGETKDDFIADLAVAVGADFIKSGAPSRAERLSKYERLLKIEQGLKN